MGSYRPIIAGNGLAIALTVIFVLPITGVLAYISTSPLDNWMVQLGTWLHDTNGWKFSTFDTQQRFAKISFAIRSIVIAVGLSFLYYWLTNWLNQGLARVSSRGSTGRETYIIEAIQPWIFVGPALVLLLLFLFVPAFSTLSLSFQEADGTRTVRNYAFLWDSSALGYVQFRYAMRNSCLLYTSPSPRDRG